MDLLLSMYLLYTGLSVERNHVNFFVNTTTVLYEVTTGERGCGEGGPGVAAGLWPWGLVYKRTTPQSEPGLSLTQ